MRSVPAAVAALWCLTAAAGSGAQQGPPQVAFRSRITLVPVDVRVLDRDGKPVTDLSQEDFIVLEDGVPQQISHFSRAALTPEPPAPGARPELRRAPADTLSPRNNRIFLIVLGRGRLQEPSKGIDATVRFIRQQLLPQDQVAVLAYNRATDFTTDHEKIAQVVERFGRRHEEIEALLGHAFSGLAGQYGDKRVPRSLQGRIDEIFLGTSDVGSRELQSGLAGKGEQVAADMKRSAEALERAEVIAGRETTLGDTFDLAAAELLGASFEEYVRASVSTLQDLDNIYAGIEYLRYLEGEKHLVFVTERGLFLPRVENDRSLAAFANDARVVIDTIQTGGVSSGPPPSLRSVPLPGPSITERFALASLKTVSELTGGLSSVMRYAREALDRVNQATSFGYLLGYYPKNTAWDGQYRRITIKVNRPGVTVLFRHGYFARDVTVPLDRRAFLAYRRIAAAGAYDRPVQDIKVSATVSPVRRAGAEVHEVVVKINIDLTRVALVLTDPGGRYVGELDVSVFCADARERLVGELWQQVGLNLHSETYNRLRREGLAHTATVSVKGEPRYVKVVVYDATSDLVGSAVVSLK